MKKKPLTARRPQEAMARFDRLLAAMAPKPEPPATIAPKRTAKKKPSRKPNA
jgi:hypothetical protein